ncbi:Mfa1 family fimbria major subunit [Phocaeicola sp.]
MKIKSLVVGMMACAALVACSNEDLVEGGNGDGNQTGGAKAYIGIKIADPTSGISRAATDGGFDYGTSSEHNITKADFLFYKDGTYVTKGSPANITVNGVEGGNIEANVPAVVVLQGNQGGEIEYPNQVLAFLNLPNEVIEEIAKKEVSIEEALAKVKSTTDIPNYAQDNNFIMTNSVYLDGTEIKNAVSVSIDNFKQTADAAKDSPVTLYVERLAAKVKMTEQNGGVDTPNIDVNVNGEKGYKLVLEVDGWGINAVNKTSYLTKQIEAWDFTWSWNSPNYSRSYWAKDTNYDEGSYPINWEAYNGNENGSSLEYRSWNDVVANKKATEYCFENTMDATTAENINATTYMVIAGHYELLAPGANKPTKINDDTKLYYYIDRYFLEEDLLNKIATDMEIYTMTKEGNQTTWTLVGPEQYEIVRASLYDGKAKFKGTGNNYYLKKNENDKIEVAAINQKLTDLGAFTAFAGGKTFFYTPIEHLNETATEDGHIGIVRNHTYNLTLNSIKNVGNGVFDPNEDIIITDKDKQFYVAATLNILSWKVVDQEVNL